MLRLASYPRSFAPCFAPEALAGRLRSASRSRRSTQVVTGSRSSLAWARKRTRRSTGSRQVTISRGVRPVGGLPAPVLLPPLANGVILLRGLRFDRALLYAELQPHVFQREVKRVLRQYIFDGGQARQPIASYRIAAKLVDDRPYERPLVGDRKSVVKRRDGIPGPRASPAVPVLCPSDTVTPRASARARSSS